MGGVCHRADREVRPTSNTYAPPAASTIDSGSIAGCRSGPDCRSEHGTSLNVEFGSTVPSAYNVSVKSPSVASESLPPANGISTEVVEVSSQAKTTESRPIGHSLDPDMQDRFAKFYARNLKAQVRHASMMEQNEQSLGVREAMTAEIAARLDRLDIFSPDMRSTRWQEFLEILQKDTGTYDNYRQTTQAVRGTGKAMTIAVVRRHPEGGHIGTLH